MSFFDWHFFCLLIQTKSKTKYGQSQSHASNSHAIYGHKSLRRARVLRTPGINKASRAELWYIVWMTQNMPKTLWQPWRLNRVTALYNYAARLWIEFALLLVERCSSRTKPIAIEVKFIIYILIKILLCSDNDETDVLT